MMGKKRLRNFNGQSFAEYAILLVIVSAVMVGSITYIKRAIQGGIKTAADEVGKQEDSYDDYETGGAKTDSTTVTATNDQETITGSRNGAQRKNLDYNTTSSGSSNSVSYREK